MATKAKPAEKEIEVVETPASESTLEVSPDTGEIVVAGTEQDFQQIKLAKIKAASVISPNDFVKISNRWEPTKDGLTKILSSLPISYDWKILSSEIKEIDGGKYAEVRGLLSIFVGESVRNIEGMGIVEPSEVGNYSLHNMVAKAETRAQKRAIDVAFGSVVNWFVKTHMKG